MWIYYKPPTLFSSVNGVYVQENKNKSNATLLAFVKFSLNSSNVEFVK